MQKYLTYNSVSLSVACTLVCGLSLQQDPQLLNRSVPDSNQHPYSVSLNCRDAEMSPGVSGQAAVDLVAVTSVSACNATVMLSWRKQSGIGQS